MKSPRPVLLGVDIGGTKTALAVRRDLRSGSPADDIRVFPTNGSPRDVLDSITVEARHLVGDSAVVGVGVSFGGHVQHGSVRSLHVPGWEETDLVERLRNEFGAEPVILNDGEAGALGEYAARAASGEHSSTFVYITVSTGVGGAILLDGAPFRGSGGLTAEIGHMVVAEDGLCSCGRIGHLEAVASGTAIMQSARDLVRRQPTSVSALSRMDPDLLSARDVAAAAFAGDRLASEILGAAGRHVGRAIASVSFLLAPDIVVVGGGVSQAGSSFWEPLLSAAEEHAFAPIRVEPAIHDNSAVMGALEIAEGLGPQAVPI